MYCEKGLAYRSCGFTVARLLAFARSMAFSTQHATQAFRASRSSPDIMAPLARMRARTLLPTTNGSAAFFAILAFTPTKVDVT